MEDDQDQFAKDFAEFATKPDAPAAPAEPVVAEEKPAEPAPAPAAPEPAAPTAEVTLEQLQKDVLEARHRERSASNRISAFAQENNKLQAMVNEMRAKLDELTAAKAAPAPTPPQPDDDDVLGNAPDLEAAVNKRVQRGTAGLESTVTELRKKLEETQQTATEAKAGLEPILTREQQARHEQTWAKLDERFTPSWREDVKTETFDSWLKGSPQQIQDLFGRANTPEECAPVLTLYYASTGKQTQTPQPTPASQGAANTNTERLRKAAGVAPRGTLRPASGPAPDDFDGNFAAFAQQLKRA